MDERSNIEKRLRRKCRGLSAEEISDAVHKLKAIQAQTDKLAIREQEMWRREMNKMVDGIRSTFEAIATPKERAFVGALRGYAVGWLGGR